MGRYASQTSVNVDRSKAEIEQILMRYGADKFGYVNTGTGAAILFQFKGRNITLEVKYPMRGDYKDNQTGEKQWDQEKRRLWRVLCIALKAKLELVDSGLTTFEAEFLAQTCLPNGQSIGSVLIPKIDQVIADGKMPSMMLLPGTV